MFRLALKPFTNLDSLIATHLLPGRAAVQTQATLVTPLTWTHGARACPEPGKQPKTKADQPKEKAPFHKAENHHPNVVKALN